MEGWWTKYTLHYVKIHTNIKKLNRVYDDETVAFNSHMHTCIQNTTIKIKPLSIIINKWIGRRRFCTNNYKVGNCVNKWRKLKGKCFKTKFWEVKILLLGKMYNFRYRDASRETLDFEKFQRGSKKFSEEVSTRIPTSFQKDSGSF